MVMANCENCGAEIKGRSKRACSRKCGVQLAVKEGRWHLPNPPNSYGPTNTNWKGGKRKQGGYIYVLAPPDHPIRGLSRGRRRYIAQHRLVMEKHLGRYLEPFEAVHHRNGIKTDNRIKNLEIVPHARPNGIVVCPHCQKAFEVH